MRNSRSAWAMALGISAALVAAPANAERYEKPRDLIGLRASEAERELDRMGYRYKDGYRGSSSRHAYWWNKQKDRCIDVKTKDGRIADVEKAAASDCNKSGSGTGTAVAVVAGVAVLAALAASSGKNKDKPAKIDDLKGIRASSADSELSARGFINVDGFKSDTTSYTIWYRDASKQCVQMATYDGIAQDVHDIGTHPKCRK